ncbi:MAG: Gfo/Idh/MocA family oxidoreductase [Nocardia sp.]|nr:Gfo/Idh/MocA family oxidoreductase [Nocardia sp.]
MSATITLGVLGAARVVPGALLTPATGLDGIEVTAIAARDPQRTTAFAAQHAIARVLGSYAEVLADPAISAVYIPTPAALHGHWVRRALAEGKHVLCEKPFTANADEAADIAQRSAGGRLVVMEAFHSVYHPAWAGLAEQLAGGAIGKVLSAEAGFVVPHTDRTDIRWQSALGGGALMDLGVYPVRLLRYLFGSPEVTAARAEHSDGVDAAMTAEFVFPGAITAVAVASMRSTDTPGAYLRVTGSAGTMHVRSPYHPHIYGQITTVTATGTNVEACGGSSSYHYQLQAFRDAVREGAPISTGAAEATAAMRVIDQIYLAAGMRPRMPLAQ